MAIVEAQAAVEATTETLM